MSTIGKSVLRIAPAKLPPKLTTVKGKASSATKQAVGSRSQKGAAIKQTVKPTVKSEVE